METTRQALHHKNDATFLPNQFACALPFQRTSRKRRPLRAHSHTHRLGIKACIHRAIYFTLEFRQSRQTLLKREHQRMPKRIGVPIGQRSMHKMTHNRIARIQIQRHQLPGSSLVSPPAIILIRCNLASQSTWSALGILSLLMLLPTVPISGRIHKVVPHRIMSVC